MKTALSTDAMTNTTCPRSSSKVSADAALPIDEALWIRVLYMLLFAVIYSIAELFAKITVVAQLIFRACSGRTQRHLLAFSADLSAYIHAIWRYLAFNDERRPWPYSPWPKG